MKKDTYNIASLSQKSLQQIRSLEEDLRNDTEEELILIAYEAEHDRLKS